MLCVGLQLVNEADLSHTLFDFLNSMMINGVARMLLKLHRTKGDYFPFPAIIPVTLAPYLGEQWH